MSTEWKGDPTCPYCGQSDQDWWDGLTDEKWDGSKWNSTCGDCGKEYTITMCVETTFSTVKKEKES